MALKGKKPKAPRKPSTRGGAATISAWEDDPEPGVLVTRPVPNLAKKPLAFTFPHPKPPAAVYQPGTSSFRYWTAAEALRRGADFWAPHLPVSNWEVGASLKVLLDQGQDLNAYYDRQALNFFHGHGATGTVYSGESPDILCHEMGHAILDALKPQLWSAASHEVAAFHESFGDMSAILSALQLPTLRAAILSDTRGHLYRSSRLSRLAEQLASAIRIHQPDAVESDCLRNAVNSFTYQNPLHLPQMAPASQLSSEPHSFSRVFTGAFFEILDGMLIAKAATPKAPSEKELLAVSSEIADILVSGIKLAPVVTNWYAQVAAGMVQASAIMNPDYPRILKAAFVRRSILSLNSASNVQSLQAPLAAATARRVARQATEPLTTIALPAGDYGLNKPLLVEAASHPRAYVARAGATIGNGSLEPESASTAARAFVDDLFSRGRVDYAGLARPESRLDHGHRLRSHRLAAENGGIRLVRRLFDCGLAH